MNNKKLGTDWENEFCEWLGKKGWWVHFITPAPDGGQPFDVIAARNGKALAIDCKTSAKPIFSINRLEENQIRAFEYWLDCGNDMPAVAIKYDNRLYLVDYGELKEGNVDLRMRKGVDL